ncbi:substrate-binding periplasmic protein [Bdellovibrio sp. HCB2-146]|uniref:substrate-binding periplasmic protein n=1 Tax=Bdellovibrio sp. HCB2-146 TaxID=3394362 RepID=UPI0039BC5001
MIFFFSAVLFAEKPEKIRVVYYHFPPDIIDTPNGPSGAAYDIWERAAKRAGIKIEWSGSIPYLRALKMLESGRVDGMLRLARTPEREVKFYFTDKAPFWGSTGIIVKKNDSLQKISTDKDVAGKKIGWLRGGTLPPFLARNRERIAWESATDNSIEVNMMKLQSDRVWGVYFIFSSTALYYLSEHHMLADYKVLPFPGSEKGSDMYAAFSRKTNKKLVDKMLHAFAEERPHYDYEKLAQHYIDMAGRKTLK